jgi:hypothetical protein
VAQPTGRDRLLAGVSAAQLATGLVGMVVGLRRRHPYDLFWMHDGADAIGRDVLTRGPPCPPRSPCWSPRRP